MSATSASCEATGCELAAGHDGDHRAPKWAAEVRARIEQSRIDHERAAAHRDELQVRALAEGK